MKPEIITEKEAEKRGLRALTIPAAWPAEKDAIYQEWRDLTRAGIECALTQEQIKGTPHLSIWSKPREYRTPRITEAKKYKDTKQTA